MSTWWPPPLVFTYTNHRGVTAVRRVTPTSVYYGTTEHHPEPCWLLRAFDHDKQSVRDFDLRRVVNPEFTQEDRGV